MVDPGGQRITKPDANMRLLRRNLEQLSYNTDLFHAEVYLHLTAPHLKIEPTQHLPGGIADNNSAWSSLNVLNISKHS